MSSLFKRVTVPLLALAAATTLCVPTRAATATWKTFGPVAPSDIAMQVDLNASDPNHTTYWSKAVFYIQLVGGNDYPQPLTDYPNVYVGSSIDYFDPQSGYVGYHTTVSGTYDCWCICTVGNSGGSQDDSTGGTLIDR